MPVALKGNRLVVTQLKAQRFPKQPLRCLAPKLQLQWLHVSPALSVPFQASPGTEEHMECNVIFARVHNGPPTNTNQDTKQRRHHLATTHKRPTSEPDNQALKTEIYRGSAHTTTPKRLHTLHPWHASKVQCLYNVRRSSVSKRKRCRRTVRVDIRGAECCECSSSEFCDAMLSASGSSPARSSASFRSSQAMRPYSTSLTKPRS